MREIPSVAGATIKMRLILPRASRSASLMAAGLSCAAAHVAQAQDNAVLKLMLNGFVADPRSDSATVSTGPWVDQPPVLDGKHVRLHTDGPMLGGGLRGTVVFHRMRGSIGMNLFGVDNSILVHDGLANPDLSTRTGAVWGESVDVSLGREFQLGPVFPYLDLRMCIDLTAAQLELHSRNDGLLGSTSYSRLSFGLGPLGGVFLPLGDSSFFDLGGYAGLLGAQRFAGLLGFGVWTESTHL